MAPRSAAEVEVCYLYAPEDTRLVQQLDKHMLLLRYQMPISIWSVDRTPIGASISSALSEHLNSASIILIFVSPDFLNSDYYNGPAMQLIMQRYQTRTVRVILVLLRPVIIEGPPLETLKAEVLPRNARPVTSWSNRDKAFVDVASAITEILDVTSAQKLLAGLGTDFQVRQQAISGVAKVDPGNIQEVAASQLSIINSYYQSGLQQSQQSFHWSLIWGGVGLGFLIAAVSFLLLRQSTDVAVASGIGGAIVEVFAATYLYLYKHASDQLAAFRASLESTQRLLLANSMCERLEGETEQNARADLIRAMVNSVVGSSLPEPHEKK